MATPNYDIDYNDKRLTAVTDEEKTEINKWDTTYGNMIADSDEFYQKQINAAEDYAETQKQNQQEQTDFAIDKIEQQKEQAKKDYTKEQSGAYVDWQKQSNQYGANAEQMAANGLAKTGYSESSQVSMWNTYQNRVAAARESYTRAVLNYDNAIKDAQLQNNALLAEIAYNALQKQLELSLQGFQYKNQLITEQADRKLQIQQLYHTKYQDVLDQLNEENRLAEEVRQADMANAREQERIEIAQGELKLAKDKFAYEKIQNAKAALSGGSSGDKTAKGGKATGAISKWYDLTSKKTSKTIAGGAKQAASAQKQNKAEAESFINDAIKSGKSKDEISRIISQARTDGALTEKQALDLLNKYCPQGLQY